MANMNTTNMFQAMDCYKENAAEAWQHQGRQKHNNYLHLHLHLQQTHESRHSAKTSIKWRHLQSKYDQIAAARDHGKIKPHLKQQHTHQPRNSARKPMHLARTPPTPLRSRLSEVSMSLWIRLCNHTYIHAYHSQQLKRYAARAPLPGGPSS